MAIEMERRRVRIRLLEDQLGTTPKDKQLYTSFIESKKPPENEGEIEVDNIALEEKGWTGFLSDENGLFVFNYMIKGFLKNSAVQLKEQHKVKQARAKVVNHVFVSPRKIYFNKQAPDGVCERPIQCQTLQGPRTSLAKSDVIAAGTELEFMLEWLPTPEIKEDLLIDILEFGRYCGLGQFRTGGYGTFEVIEFSAIGDSKSVKKRKAAQKGE